MYVAVHRSPAGDLTPTLLDDEAVRDDNVGNGNGGGEPNDQRNAHREQQPLLDERQPQPQYGAAPAGERRREQVDGRRLRAWNIETSKSNISFTCRQQY